MRPTDLGEVTNLITQLTDYSLLRHRSRSPRLLIIDVATWRHGSRMVLVIDVAPLRHGSRTPRLLVIDVAPLRRCLPECSISGWKRREDPTTAGKIDVDLVLVLVQHDGSRCHSLRSCPMAAASQKGAAAKKKKKGRAGSQTVNPLATKKGLWHAAKRDGDLMSFDNEKKSCFRQVALIP
ncbi:hypothetical protein BHE74_00041570 [Ensete ventricosum]|nr:hypothetical protein GW17_00055241 [Ensete ventricosum]RWW52035.1 hypothetical protein BHE74_00041570 [Ensete ventricosum]